jgi:dienelactone hydrolase
MPIRAKCRQCGRVYQVKDQFAGQVLPCKECGGKFKVPEPEPEPLEAVDILEDDLLVEDDGFDEPSSRKRPRRPAGGDPWEDEFGGGASPQRKRRPPGAASEPPSAPPRAAGARSGARRPPSAEPPVRGGRSSRGGAASPSKSKSKRRAAQPPGALDGDGVRYAAVGGIVLLILATFGWMLWSRNAGAGGGGDVAGGNPAAATTGADGRFDITAVAVPRFPDLGSPQHQPSGVTTHEIHLAGVAGNGAGPGQAMRMRVYLPPGDHAPGSLGCVLVPPAGTNLLVGCDIDDGSYHDETLPYAQAGFAVVHFSIDGPADLDNPDDAAMAAAYGQFRAAAAGVVNARNALEFAIAKLPQVDPRRIYSAGHSSAGVLSLLFAAHEPRLAGCIAYAPAADVELRLGEAVNEFGVGQLLPGVGDFVRQSSPKTHAAHIECPVFLFHARDDSNEPFTTSEAFAEQLKGLGKDVTLKLVPTGDHYDSMVREGIPAAIAWLRSRPENQGRSQPTTQPTSSPSPQPSNSQAPLPEQPGANAPTSPPLPTNPPVPSFGELPPQPPAPGDVFPQAAPGARPILDFGPMPPPGMPVVVLELKGYNGPRPAHFAAMDALQNVPWVNRPWVRVEGSKNRLIIGVRGGAVDTGRAKTALEANGFQIGSSGYHGSGLQPD